MYKLLFLLPLLAPAVTQAQVQTDSDGYAYGFYTLSAGGAKHDAFMKLRGPQLLIVRNVHGKNLKYTSADVTRFNIGTEHYFTLTDRQLPGLKTVLDMFNSKSAVTTAFVQHVDSGQVVLLRYSYLQTTAGSMGSGGIMTNGGSSEIQYYLLRRADIPTFTLVQGNLKRFRELLRPYLAARPDLLKYLDEKRLTYATLPDLIHSLNTGVSYLPPERYPRLEQ